MRCDIKLVGGRLHQPSRTIEKAAVAIHHGKVVALGTVGDLAHVKSDAELDCSDHLISPGLVDLQVNGGGGFMFSTDISTKSYEAIGRAHLLLGTTSICPTVITGPREDMRSAVELLSTMTRAEVKTRSRFVGTHVEGPFLSTAKRGGHPKDHILSPDLTVLRQLFDAAAGTLAIWTLAPELQGASELVEFLVSEGVIVSAGHSESSTLELHRAADLGLSMATHLFNGMAGVTSREPGIAGAVLASSSLSAGLIGDLLHVSVETLRVAIRARGHESLYLTTDAVSPMGSTAGAFDLYGTKVTVREGGCYTHDGVLAGTATPLATMVRNVRDVVGLPEAEALAMATSTPARTLGSDAGAIRVGCPADIVVFDNAFNPVEVLLGGERVR